MRGRSLNFAVALLLLGIATVSNAQLLGARQAMSADGVPGSRRAIPQRVGQRASSATVDQGGRTQLVLGTFLLSLSFYGGAAPLTLDIKNPRRAVGLYALTSSAGFLVPLYATREGTITDAEASLSFYGGTRGPVHGWSVYRLLTGKVTTADVDRTEMAFVTLTGIGELISGVYIARSLDVSAGTVEAIAAGGDIGLYFGGGAAHLLYGVFDGYGTRSSAGTMLIGSGVGLLAGRWLAEQQSYTRGDAWVLRATNAVGAYAPLALVDMFEPEGTRAYTAAAMAGGLLGAGVGHHLTHRRDFTTEQGLVVGSSAVAAGLLGAGLVYVLSSDDTDNRTLYLAASALGATAGLWLGHRSFAEDARTSTEAHTYASAPSGRWTIRFPTHRF